MDIHGHIRVACKGAERIEGGVDKDAGDETFAFLIDHNEHKACGGCVNDLQ